MSVTQDDVLGKSFQKEAEENAEAARLQKEAEEKEAEAARLQKEAEEKEAARLQKEADDKKQGLAGNLLEPKKRKPFPGPTWPLDSHPDNVRAFVQKWMRPSCWQADAVIAPNVQLPPKPRGRKPKKRPEAMEEENEEEEESGDNVASGSTEDPRKHGKSASKKRKAVKDGEGRGMKKSRKTVEVIEEEPSKVGPEELGEGPGCD